MQYKTSLRGRGGGGGGGQMGTLILPGVQHTDVWNNDKIMYYETSGVGGFLSLPGVQHTDVWNNDKIMHYETSRVGGIFEPTGCTTNRRKAKYQSQTSVRPRSH